MPDAPVDDRARYLRQLYRRSGGERSLATVQAEYARLFAGGGLRLDHILASAWIEGRELAGWTRDRGTQQWRRGDGSAVVDDDGSEWAGR